MLAHCQVVMVTGTLEKTVTTCVCPTKCLWWKNTHCLWVMSLWRNNKIKNNPLVDSLSPFILASHSQQADQELTEVLNQLWKLDVNRLRPGTDYTISLQVSAGSLTSSLLLCNTKHTSRDSMDGCATIFCINLHDTQMMDPTDLGERRATRRLITVVKHNTDTHCPSKMNTSDLSEPLIFQPAPAGLELNIWNDEASWHLSAN